MAARSVAIAVVGHDQRRQRLVARVAHAHGHAAQRRLRRLAGLPAADAGAAARVAQREGHGIASAGVHAALFHGHDAARSSRQVAHRQPAAAVAEREVHLVTKAPRIGRGGEHRLDRRGIRHRRTHGAAHGLGFDPELFGIGDVLPCAAPAGGYAGGLRAEVRTGRRDPVRRRLQHLDQRGACRTIGGGAHRQPQPHPLAGNRERDSDPRATNVGDTIAVRVHLYDGRVHGVAHCRGPTGRSAARRRRPASRSAG